MRSSTPDIVAEMTDSSASQSLETNAGSLPRKKTVLDKSLRAAGFLKNTRKPIETRIYNIQRPQKEVASGRSIAGRSHYIFEDHG